jgi:hypothetical protein
MNMKQAQELVGNQPAWALKNMVKALEIMPLLNTAQDKERLAAAKFILSTRRGK